MLATGYFKKLDIIRVSGKFEQKNKQEKKVHRIIGFFLPLPDVLMLMTDFLQGIALNHCRWCGIEDNRCGRHVADL